MIPRWFIGLTVSDEASKKAPLVYYAVEAGRYRNGGLYGRNRHDCYPRNGLRKSNAGGNSTMYAGEILDELVSWTPDQSQPDRLRAEVRLEVRRGR